MIGLLRTLDHDYRAWRYRTKVEPTEIALVRRVLRPGDTAVDIGAHKGAFTYWMRKSVGPTGRVIAVEPQPRLAERLQHVVRARGWSNVRVEACGLSKAPGQLELWVPDGGAPSPGASVEPGLARAGSVPVRVEVRTLDQLVAPGSPVRLVKCDVEGHELAVFQGGQRVLSEARPVLLFECEARHHVGSRIEEVFAHLEGLGMRGWFILGEALRPLGELRPEHQDPAQVPYANNFVFAFPEVWTP
jgi:FkbM family methyltransferase